MSKQWLKAHKHDSYYKAAKAQGYRSRAAYKLKQINNKFKLIRAGDIVLDFGAAPGGWSQVAAELVGDKGRVIGVDINPIKNVKHAEFLVADLTDENTIDLINERLDGYDADVIISDAAPNISGNYNLDQAKSIFLAEAVLNLAKRFLKSKGKLVLKVFEGADFPDFFLQLKSSFRYCKKYSPQASRARSSEIYLIGLGYNKINDE